MPPPNDFDLMQLHVRALFLFDSEGRMLGTNEAPPFSAPRVYLGRTAEGNVWHVRRGLPHDQVAALEEFLQCEPPLADRGVEPACLARMMVILARDQPVTAVHRGPAFVFETAPEAGAGTVRLAAGEEARFHPQLREMGWEGPLNSTQEPCFVVEVGGEIVSLCHSSRSLPGAAAAGVSTSPAYRRRGYARRVVQSWAADVMAGGRLAFYSTTWENAASTAIAQGLRLRFFGEDCHIT